MATLLAEPGLVRNEFIRIYRALVVAAAMLVPTASNGQSTFPLGSRDGKGLPPLDTGGVAVGTLAPDFTLEA